MLKGKKQGVVRETPGIRVLGKRSFMQRFTQAERIAIRNSTDDIVIDIHEDLKMTSFVDLDHPDTGASLDYLTAIGLLVAGRKDEMLVDGEESEKYEP